MNVLKIIKTGLVLAIALVLAGNDVAQAMQRRTRSQVAHYSVDQEKSSSESTRSKASKKHVSARVVNVDATRNLWLNSKLSSAVATIKRLKEQLAGKTKTKQVDQNGEEFFVDTEQARREEIRRAQEDAQQEDAQEEDPIIVEHDNFQEYETHCGPVVPYRENKKQKTCMGVISSVLGSAKGSILKHKKLIFVTTVTTLMVGMAVAAYMYNRSTCPIPDACPQVTCAPDQSALVEGYKNELERFTGSGLARCFSLFDRSTWFSQTDQQNDCETACSMLPCIND